MEASTSKSVQFNGRPNSLKRKYEEESITLKAETNNFHILKAAQELPRNSLQYATNSSTGDLDFESDDFICYSPETDEDEETTEAKEDYKSQDTYIQKENCFATSQDLPQCCECEKEPMTSKYSCRFFEFRIIERDNGAHKARGFLDPDIDPNDQDFQLWTAYEPRLIVDRATADYILGCIASQFCDISQRELDIRKDQSNVAWKRSVLKVREVCDVCETSLFNYHWTCQRCGTIICIDCFEERQAGICRWKPKTKADKEERDNFFWLKCQASHPQHDLMLTQITIGNALLFLNQNIHKLCDQRNITQNCRCLNKMKCEGAQGKKTPHSPLGSLTRYQELRKEIKIQRQSTKLTLSRRLGFMEMKRINQNVQRTFIAQGRIVKILEPTESDDCYQLFQDQWQKGHPIVVGNATKSMNKYTWSPEYFSSRFGHERHVMIDCQRGTTINRVAMKHFWDGFQSIKKRIPTDCEDKCVLKLKDWPTSDDFANVMKDHFDDFMKAVPMAEYTRRNGKFNLARYLPDFFSRPDLGPKMYSAYSQAHPSLQGSTNLHLDVSDAVNVMVHVSKPVDSHLAPNQYDISSIQEALVAAGADEIDKKNLLSRKKLPGAIWHIFPADKADNIRNLLHKVARENKKPLGVNDDPIHDQNWYIDGKLRKRLKATGVDSFTIVQYEGDAIFIPAGAPHQVLNILDCIKVALDFVAPENLSECINLTEEFRILSTRHQNREDKLQIKNILYHTVKNLVPAQGSAT